MDAVGLQIFTVLLIILAGNIAYAVLRHGQPAQARALVRTLQATVAGERAPDGRGRGGRAAKLQLEGEPPGPVLDNQPIKDRQPIVHLEPGRQPDPLLPAPDPAEVDLLKKGDALLALCAGLDSPHQPFLVVQLFPGVHDLGHGRAAQLLRGAPALGLPPFLARLTRHGRSSAPNWAWLPPTARHDVCSSGRILNHPAMLAKRGLR